MSDEPGGIEWDEAWIVTKGWGEDPVMLFPTKESAEAYKNMCGLSQVGVKRLSEHMEKKKQKIRKEIINELDYAWTQARNAATWKD
jgi:hypothetical protein